MNERIVSNPQVCGGEPCIKGTRIPVHVIPELNPRLCRGEWQKLCFSIYKSNLLLYIALWNA